IVERYTKPGEVILDPMAGSGTLMLGCMLGRNVVLVELEGKFCKMCRGNWEIVKMHPQLGYQMGWCQVIQGDARQLGELLVDKCIFSPPYAGAEQFLDKEWINREQPRPHRPQVDKIVTSPPYAEAHDAKDLGVGDKDRADLRAYSYLKTETEGQIGNLPYGNIDSIITSPPYEGALEASSRHTRGGIPGR
ncbi:unnamed protein product, partial [marine sediment metagenome]